MIFIALYLVRLNINLGQGKEVELFKMKDCGGGGSFFINGKPKGKVLVSRDLKQEDPSSPFLFMLVAGFLSHL